MMENKDRKSIIEIIDSWIFIKKGYSFLAHILPFIFAAMLLIVLSVPRNNILIKISTILTKPSRLWILMIIINVITICIYIFSLYNLIQKAYFFNYKKKTRTIITFIIFTSICTLITLGILSNKLERKIILSDIWTCFLVSTLSLTGIGFKLPSKWIDSIGVKLPDYSEGQNALKQAKEIITKVKKTPRATLEDVNDFLEELRRVKSNIRQNIDYESASNKISMNKIKNKLQSLIHEIEKFSTGTYRKEDLAAIFRNEKRFQYESTINIHNSVFEKLIK